MGQLADFLNQPTAKEVSTTVYDSDGNYTQSLVLDVQPASPHDMLVLFGHDPLKWAVDGVARVSHRELVDGRTMSTYSYRLRETTVNLDVDFLIREARKAKPTVSAATGGRVFVFQASDLQLGKIDGDGIAGTVERYMASIEAAAAALKAAKGIGSVHLVFAGDCIENGGVSQGGKLAWRQSLTVTEQVRVWRRLLMTTVKLFAPLTAELFVTVVGGNHDDATRLPVQTRADDNWATEGAIAVADALLENPEAFGHVTVQVPPVDQGWVTVKIQESIFTVLHGHQFRKGKAQEWLASQSFYQGNPSVAHFMLYGHWHSLNVAQDGPRTLICSPTFDGGSAWYRDLTGAVSRQGGLIYVTDGAEFEGLTRV